MFRLRKVTLALTCVVILFLTANVIVLAGSQPSTSGRTAASAVHALFDLSAPTRSPFPSNRFTVVDRSHNTRLRVNLPKPDCHERPSDCEDIDVINMLDGFNLQPRLSVPFDGHVDVATVKSETIFLISLGSTLDTSDRGVRRIGINQVVWDTATNTLHVESDELLDRHTRYALIVTNGVQDAEGRPVKASEAFRRFRQTVPGGYKRALLQAIRAARRVGIREREIVSASVFTTQSATAILEKMRDQIKAETPAPADFNLGSDGTRTVFPLSEVTGITWNQQTGNNPPTFNPVQLNLSFLRIIPGAVGRIAFGKYLSPDYTVHPGEYIPPVGTRTGTPQVQGTSEVFFNLFMPTGSPPPGGWPVAIFGHGGGGGKDPDLLRVAASLAARGVATIAINTVGHGFGSLSMLTVNQTASEPVTFTAGGRGIDQNGDGIINDREGIRAAPPRMIIDDSDGFRQTVADLMQLVRVIEVGVDADGDALHDLNPSRIYYVGQSLGGMIGTDFLAVEPTVRVGVLTVPGGPRTSRVLNNFGDRPLYGRFLAGRTPSLINAPGVTSIVRSAYSRSAAIQ